jgi:hypothetical protein
MSDRDEIKRRLKQVDQTIQQNAQRTALTGQQRMEQQKRFFKKHQKEVTDFLHEVAAGLGYKLHETPLTAVFGIIHNFRRHKIKSIEPTSTLVLSMYRKGVPSWSGGAGFAIVLDAENGYGVAFGGGDDEPPIWCQSLEQMKETVLAQIETQWAGRVY